MPIRSSSSKAKRDICELAELPLADESLQDPWSLVRLAMGSVASESWRLKQALKDPAKSWKLRDLPQGSTWWAEYKRTQTFEQFKSEVPFRPNTTSGVEVVVVGDDEDLERALDLKVILEHVEVFLGMKVKLIEADEVVRPKISLESAGLRTSPDGLTQAGGHLVLAYLQGRIDPRATCTLALTSSDLYPPRNYDFITGMTEARSRLGLYSSARYFHYSINKALAVASPDEEVSEESDEESGSEEERIRSVKFEKKRTSAEVAEEFLQLCDVRAEQSDEGEKVFPEDLRRETSLCFVKLLCREALKLCGARECHLMHCLMNPIPEAPAGSGLQPEVICLLPLSLCSVCLRKLHWISQADLLDRYTKLPPVMHGWFLDETKWLWDRMTHVGLPTTVSLTNPVPFSEKLTWSERHMQAHLTSKHLKAEGGLTLESQKKDAQLSSR
eukprot:TRINITY_DN6617_c0_g1_i1.p1 TRINITY_DN6617_c0_g1~~TRINITY_DN6617_c0_g1_i1.p1  ORF type:complete len:443 (+),score=83.59 TRINITY_DN6617_c0_g1_i1:63-1391(+)